MGVVHVQHVAEQYLRTVGAKTCMSPTPVPERFVVALKSPDRARPELGKLHDRCGKIPITIAIIRLRRWLVVGDQRIVFSLELRESGQADAGEPRESGSGVR